MKNKILLLLSLFLLLSAATQCMEQAIVSKPRTVQEICDDRDRIYHEGLNAERSRQLLGECTVVNPIKVLHHILFQDNLSTIKTLLSKQSYKTMCCHIRYSYLGIAVVAIERPNFTYEGDRYGYYINCLLMQKPKQASFKEKKEYIRELCVLGFKPTDADKELALLVYEEHKSTTSKKRFLLQHSHFLSKMEIPQDIINFISLCLLETEELLL